MQLSDIRTAVRAKYGISSSDGNVSDTALNSLINGALREITLMRDWDWNVDNEDITLVADQEEYARDADARKTMRVLDVVSGREILQVNPRFAVRYRDQDGFPVYWFVEKGILHIVPKPSPDYAGKVLEHTFQADEEPLVNDADTPTLPDYAIDLLISRTAMRMAARLGDSRKYSLNQEEFDLAMETLVNDARQATGSPRMLSRRDWTRQGGF